MDRPLAEFLPQAEGFLLKNKEGLSDCELTLDGEDFFLLYEGLSPLEAPQVNI